MGLFKKMSLAEADAGDADVINDTLIMYANSWHWLTQHTLM